MRRLTLDQNRAVRRLLHCLCPNRCACCSRLVYASEEICEACAEALPLIPSDTCPACGKPKRACVCGRRKRTVFPCVSPLFYAGVVQTGIKTLKLGKTAHGAAFFARRMASAARRAYGGSLDGIVYVPMTRKAIDRRGYNQSRLLAKRMGKELNLPVLDGALRRLYDAQSQHTAGMRQRKGNVFGVFEADPALVAGKHLLLVDDIITTGATLEECGKMLLLAGCEEVLGVTAASTPLKRKTNPDKTD